MASRRQTEPEPERTPRRTATTPEGREKQIIALAFDLAEKRIRQGTATSQEVTHFLKLGSTRERLEQERLEHENELLVVKREAIESQKRVEAMYTEALQAMRAYSGQKPVQSDDEYED